MLDNHISFLLLEASEKSTMKNNLKLLVPAVDSGRFPLSMRALSKGPQLAPLASAMEATKVTVTKR